ncbi:hypothetical protein LTR66_008662 [Elasticomyces elasticus]|nr:hypothetical protein LTR66_008662 [Elasticomyces elasticus]
MRSQSGNVVAQDVRTPHKQPSPPSVHYTCLIRLPFPRGDFEDPPQVEWDAVKDRALWKIISKSRDLDWQDISTRFDVSLSFLLQQAAWLYERHFAEMKAQMQKLGVSNAPSLAANPNAVNNPVAGGVLMQRLGSAGSRAPSALSARSKDSPALKGDGSLPGTPGTAAPPISRIPSSITVTQSHLDPPVSPRQVLDRPARNFMPPSQRPTSAGKAQHVGEEADQSLSPRDESVSSSSESEAERQNMTRSQAFRWPPRFTVPKSALGTITSDPDADDDDEDSPDGFLSFASAAQGGKQDPAATLRSSPPKPAHADRNAAKASTDKPKRPDTAKSSASSASSSAATSALSAHDDGTKYQRRQGVPPGALNPKHRAELARLSPRLRKDGSDGSPSMGSSFSDLDDASISRSALEEALLSDLQHESVASKVSTISQALRSRYL